MARKAFKRRRKALGFNDRDHVRLARNYLARAKRDFQLAQEQEMCRPSLGRLIEAQSNYIRAYEHTIASGAAETPPLIAFGQKVHDAITAFSEGPCMRRSPYDK